MIDKLKAYKHIVALSGIIILAFLFRILSWYTDATVARDSIFYINMAETWHKHGGYSVMVSHIPYSNVIPFLFPWQMKLLMSFGLSGESAGLVLVIALGSLLPLISYAIAIVVLHRKELALGTALLTALHPSLIELSSEIIRDTLYLFFSGITILCLLCAVKHQRWWYWTLSGSALALAVMTRYESFEFFVLVFGVLLASALFRWIKFVHICIFLLCFLSAFTLTILLIYWLAGVSPLDHSSYYYYWISNMYFKLFIRSLFGYG